MIFEDAHLVSIHEPAKLVDRRFIQKLLWKKNACCSMSNLAGPTIVNYTIPVSMSFSILFSI